MEYESHLKGELKENIMVASSKAKLTVDDLVGGPASSASLDRPIKETKTVSKVFTSSKTVSEPVIKKEPIIQPVAAPIIPVSAPVIPIMTPSSPVQSYPQQNYTQRQFIGYNGNGYDRPIPDANVPTEEMKGILDIQPEGHGFLRPKFVPSDKDIYISSSQIRKFNLKNGDMVTGQARKPKENERYYGLLKVEKVNDIEVDKLGKRADFNLLTPVYPQVQIKLETGKIPVSTRLIDLIAPIGMGQRGLIVSPPKAGKTWLLKEIANGVTENNKDIHLMMVLVGERPEEVTDISRSVHGEVIASNFDEAAENQTRVAEISLDRAKRLVENGRNVVILLDSITRLARAYNLCIPPSGRTLSGGFDPMALYPPKQFFGAARAFENGGSLTIIGTALVETGSRMDDLIYEEFKGTGNMELHLERRLAERRVFPSVDVSRSGTRHEELLFGEKTMAKIATMRRMLEVLSEQERTELLIDRLLKTKSNAEFIESLGK